MVQFAREWIRLSYKVVLRFGVSYSLRVFGVIFASKNIVCVNFFDIFHVFYFVLLLYYNSLCYCGLLCTTLYFYIFFNDIYSIYYSIYYLVRTCTLCTECPPCSVMVPGKANTVPGSYGGTAAGKDWHLTDRSTQHWPGQGGARFGVVFNVV